MWPAHAAYLASWIGTLGELSCVKPLGRALVTITNLRYLHRLLWLLLLLQITTVLLVTAGPVPPKPLPNQAGSTATHSPGPLMP